MTVSDLKEMIEQIVHSSAAMIHSYMYTIRNKIKVYIIYTYIIHYGYPNNCELLIHSFRM